MRPPYSSVFVTEFNPNGTTHLKTAMFFSIAYYDIWRHLSNNVVLVPQQVGPVRRCVTRLPIISVSVLATGQGNTPLAGRLRDIG